MLFLIGSSLFAQRAKYGDNTPKPLKRIRNFDIIRQSDDINTRISRLNAIKQSNKLIKIGMKDYAWLQSQQPEWYPIGPKNIGGRVRTLAWDPINSNVIYLGAAAGGIWKSTDKGANWIPIFDNEIAISMGALAIDPHNNKVLYAGTGEMIIGGGMPYLGAGLFKTIDGGNNWELMGLTEVGAFSKIYVHPANSNIIIAGAAVNSGGLYISENGGIDWEKKFSGDVSDVTINTANPDEIIIGVNAKGIYYTNDRGNSWVARNNFNIDVGGRVSVQAFANNFNYVYALFERTNERGVIYKSTDKGVSWSRVFDGDYAFFRGQGFYDNFIEISPSNPDIVLAGGIQLWRTSNGGVDWSIVNDNSSPDRMHVDIHTASFNPKNSNEVLVGNDGGVYYSSNSGIDWKNINNNLQITQFYAMAIDYSENDMNYGGSQDNGSIAVSKNNSRIIAGGDGFDMFVHPNDNSTIFGELYYGIPFKYKSNGSLQYLDDNLPTNDSGLWHSPFIIDDRSGAIYLGLHGLYTSLDYGESWVALTQRYDYQFSAIAVSGVKSNIIYAGNTKGQLLYSSNYGTTWVDITSKDFPARYITDIKTSGKDVGTVYVTFGGYDLANVFKSTDNGATWSNISNTLPNVNVNCIAINPLDEDNILVGTDIGVFISYYAGKNWYPFGVNMPKCPITDLMFHKNMIKSPGIVLRAATHGRSMWEIVVPTYNNVHNVPIITSPIGGEYSFEHSNMMLSWWGMGSPVNLYYSIDNGKSWYKIKDSISNSNYMWSIPEISSENSRIKVVSADTSLVSNIFTIAKLKKGTAVNTWATNFTPYGIAYNGKSGIWVTDYYSNRLRLLDSYDFHFIKEIALSGKNLYTDIAYDKINNIIYVNRLNNEQGNGSVIVVSDTNGNVLDELISPAKDYPIGLGYDNGYLYSSERDNRQLIYKFKPESPSEFSVIENPNKGIALGPRSMAFGNGLLHQIFTNYSSNVLQGATIELLDLANSTVVDNVPLLSNRVINARGIDYDERDGTYWVSDFDGNIYKVIGDTDKYTSIKIIDGDSISIFPNPANDRINIVNSYSTIVVEIYNIYGEFILGTKSNNSVVELNISNFSNGMYLIRYSYDGGYGFTKFIVQR